MENIAGCRGLAVVTGACGGMAMACARNLGRRYDLLLSDIDPDLLAMTADRLRDEGYVVTGEVAGDLRDAGVIETMCDAIARTGNLAVLLHTAGVSPISGLAWQDIMEINLIATERLLGHVQPLLQPNAVTVLIASIAGHMAVRDADVDALLDAPLAPGFLEAIAPWIVGVSAAATGQSPPILAYLLSKRGVIRACERSAVAWAERSARIVSISPGIIWTPMGRREIDGGANVAKVLQATPMGRVGTAMEIAQAVEFLASDQASYITGCGV